MDENQGLKTDYTLKLVSEIYGSEYSTTEEIGNIEFSNNYTKPGNFSIMWSLTLLQSRTEVWKEKQEKTLQSWLTLLMHEGVSGAVRISWK